MMLLRILVVLALLPVPAAVVAQTLDIHAPGGLKNNDGIGLPNRTDFAPGMGVAFVEHPTILRSQVNESGGGAVGGDQCATKNYIDSDGGTFDWWDTYCERRGKARTSLCPRKRVHQGLDMARLAVTEGQVVRKGDFIGFMSRDFGGHATTYHLHLELWKDLGEGNVPVPLYFTYALAQSRNTGLPIRIVDTGEIVTTEADASAEINVNPMISSFWTTGGDTFGLIASRDERVLLNLGDADAVGNNERITLVNARKQDSESRSHYVGDLVHESDACGSLRVPVSGPIADDALSLRLEAHIPTGVSCKTDDWSVIEFNFDFDRLNPEFVPFSVDMASVRSQQVGVPGVVTPDQPELVRVSKSEITRNWSAITPQSPFPAWPEYLLDWSGLDRSAPIFDSAGNEIPSFTTDPAGVGLWWYWIHKRAGGSGVLDPLSVSFVELSKGMAGVDDISHPAASRYLNQYIALSAVISNL